MTARSVSRLHLLPNLAVALCIMLILVVAGTSAAAPPAPPDPLSTAGSPSAIPSTTYGNPLLSYQGRLTDPTGDPKNGPFTMTFRLYDMASGGAALWTEGPKNIAVSNGLFSTLLGDTSVLTPYLTYFDGRDLWLGVQVSNEELSRIPVAYAPYALYAANATNASNIITGTLNFARFSAYSDLMNETKLGVERDQVAKGDHLHDSRYVNDNAGEVDNADVPDQALTPEKIAGTASVMGHNHYGSIWVGTLSNVTGLAVQNRGTGDGISGHAGANDFSAGLHGIGPNGYPGYGVYGEGYMGVYGATGVQDGRGVIGYAGGGQPGQIAVAGRADSPDALAGYFLGPVQVEGDLIATGVKPFRIDHPLDPANKYLYHFAVEGPEVRNQYEGMAVLEANGEATVELPDYFQALNLEGSYRYQLTCVGGYAPVYIAKEISGNRFVIGGGRPGLKVSWQVTAVRNDPYLRDHPVQAEVTKSAEAAGKYQYPEGYGQSESQGEAYERIPSVEVRETVR